MNYLTDLWRVVPNGPEIIGEPHLDDVAVENQDGMFVLWCTNAQNGEAKAHAERLVACWNACRGIPTEVLAAVDPKRLRIALAYSGTPIPAPTADFEDRR